MSCLLDKELSIRLIREKEGFKIIGEATNGEEALDLIEAFRPHIVITQIWSCPLWMERD